MPNTDATCHLPFSTVVAALTVQMVWLDVSEGGCAGGVPEVGGPRAQVVREASRRVLGLRPFDVQLIGGMILHAGQIAEMRTGEGKTLVAVLPAYLNALSGKGVQASPAGQPCLPAPCQRTGQCCGSR